MDAKEVNEVRIRELEEDIKALIQRSVERDTELERSGIFLFPLLSRFLEWDFTVVSFKSLIVISQICVCRLKERAKRAGTQRKEEESERKSLQVTLQSML